ncbi:GGDEF domain-containing protein [Sphingobium aromaticiconvertens]|uniref:GGDEF domain-containing protein n=1 Tax=Sphingobium aromaticiconvertens TaxID=365341 RepID=UPI003016A456
MSVASVVLSLLFGTSVIMTIAMGVAWLHFGRQKHVLTWTAAYAVSIVQWLANAGGFFLHSWPLYMVTGVGLVVSASLLAVGIRQRSGRPVPVALLGIPAGIAIVATAIALSPMGSQAMQGMIIPVYVGVLILISAVSLWPRKRPFTAPELGFFAILILYAICQGALAASAALIRGPEEGKELYRAILGLFMPTIYVGTGVSAVLVVAGDLAEKLRRQVSHDPLTGILNRRGLEDATMRAIANAHRHKRALSIVVCDLDGFKALNDTHGHIAGDDALRAFAYLLIAAMRRGDVVGRMGGDEFGVLLVDTTADAAAEVMERVRSETQCLTLDRSPGLQLRASFGIAQIEAADVSLNDLVARADAALYAAKNAGRDRINVWRQAA